VALALAAGNSATGCAAKEREPEEANLGDCSSAWVPVTGGNRSDSEPPTDLLFSGGDLFFFRFEWGPDGSTSSDLVQFDLRSPSRELATAVLVPDVYSAPMWVDDNELVFTQSGEVRSVPLSGGTLRVRSTFGSENLGDTRWLGVTSGSFYFTRYGLFGVIWKVSLGGGPVGLFANLGPTWGDEIEPPMVQSAEGMLLRGRPQSQDGVSRPAAVVIAGDGAVRELPEPDGPASQAFLTRTGVIHIVGAPQTESAQSGGSSGGDGIKKAQEYPDLRLWLTPLGGGELTEFWPDRPAAVLPQHIESDGRDGWFVTATEPFNDGYLHDTLWQVWPNDARRLACNPSPESSQIQTESRTGQAFASGDGSVYLVSLRGKSQFWELVQVSYVQADGER
jgi:hypothetical protein